MDQIFGLKNKTLKKYWKMGKKHFCWSEKVGTMLNGAFKNAFSHITPPEDDVRYKA